MSKWKLCLEIFYFSFVIFISIIVDAKKHSKTHEVKISTVRVSREEVKKHLLSQVQNEIKQLEKTEKELRAKLDEKLDAKSKYFQKISKNK